MRWMLRIAGSLAVAALLLSVAVLLLPGERIAQVALERIEAATGRAVTVEGDVDIGYFPMLRVRTGALRVANAGWSQSDAQALEQATAIVRANQPLELSEAVFMSPRREDPAIQHALALMLDEALAEDAQSGLASA